MTEQQYKHIEAGHIFKMWQITTDGSQTKVCLKLQNGEAADLATGEFIHIHPTKKVQSAASLPDGRVGLLKNRPGFVSPYDAGRVKVEYFVIVGTGIESEFLVQWPNSGTKYGDIPKEVNIILQGIAVLIMKVAKLLQSQAEVLSSLVQGDIMRGTENFMPSEQRKDNVG